MHDDHVIADLIHNPEGQGKGGRHTGFKAVSTGRGDNKTTPTTNSPSPLRDLCKTYRHSRAGGNPQGGAYNKPKQPPESPSPLTAEDQSLSQCLTLGSEGENDASASSQSCKSFIIPLPSFPRRRETTGQGETGETSPTQPTESPSPLMGEESKVRVKQVQHNQPNPPLP